MLKTGTALVVACAATMLAQVPAFSVELSHTEVKGDRLDLSREQRPFPKGPIIVNAQKSEMNEKTVASNDADMRNELVCPPASKKTEKDESCQAIPKRDVQLPAS